MVVWYGYREIDYGPSTLCTQTEGGIGGVTQQQLHTSTTPYSTAPRPRFVDTADEMKEERKFIDGL